jgi:uncharacterized membrane protein
MLTIPSSPAPAPYARFAPLLLPALFGAAMIALYRYLPAELETHFALDGTPNGTMSRAAFCASGLVLTTALTAFGIARSAPPSPGNSQVATKAAGNPVGTALHGSALFVVAIYGALAARAVGLLGASSGARGLAPLALLVAIFLFALGLLLPKVPQNRFVGLRTAATLADPELWARVHRRAGHLYVLTGLFGMASAFLAPSLALPLVGGSVLVASALALLLGLRH